MDLTAGTGGSVIAVLGLALSALAVAIALRIIRPVAAGKEARTWIGGFTNRLVKWIVGGSPRAQGVRIGSLLMLGAVGTTAGIIAAIIFLGSAISQPGPDVHILSPSEGDVVALDISVEGEARERADDEVLVIFVRPLPNDPFQDYWAQQLPQQIDEHRWIATPVYVGAPDDEPGTPFKVCAVITRSEISPGEPFGMLPPGPYDCVLVTRA